MTKLTSKMLLELAAELEKKETPDTPRQHTTKRQQNAEATLEYIRNNGGATIKELRKALKVSEASVFNYLNDLDKDGKIERHGRRPVRYFLAGTVAKVEENKEISDAAEKILQYASDNVGKKFSVHQMSKDIGYNQSYVNKIVKDLKKRKLLASDFNRGSLDVQRKASKKTSQPERDPLMEQIDFLAWQYIKGTKDANLLSFLSWLEKK